MPAKNVPEKVKRGMIHACFESNQGNNVLKCGAMYSIRSIAYDYKEIGYKLLHTRTLNTML